MKPSHAILALAGTWAAFTLPVFAQQPPKTFHYSNPIHVQDAIPGDELRDPCIIHEGDTYYLVFTVYPFRNREEIHLDDPDQGSSPGIRLYTSKDLKTWSFDRWLVKSADLPADCPYKHRFWAPEIHKIHGKFYLIFTADNWSKKEFNPAGTWGTAGYAFVGVANQVDGPYEHITYIKGAACDTSLFGDDDGRTYAFIPRGNIDVQEIDLTQLDHGVLKLLGKPRTIVRDDNSDIGLAEKPEYLEGPWPLKIGKRYVLLDACPYKTLGYWTGAAYADHPLGHWTKDPRGKVFFGGHVSAFDGPDGRPWFSYREEKDPSTRGRLCIDPFELDADGRIRCAEPTFGPVAIPLPPQAGESRPKP